MLKIQANEEHMEDESRNKRGLVVLPVGWL